MSKKLTTTDELTEFLLYTTPNGDVKVEIFFRDENVWLTQKRMAELFGKGRSTITEHLQKIFAEGELEESMVCREFRHTTEHGAIPGKTQESVTKYYNLDAIISVGYRVSSRQATQFRIWATQKLREFMIKGFVMDDERLKNGQYFGKDYFEELLERVRSIRASERRIYQKITDIFSECSIDYDPKSEVTKNFFATVQNKFHYAITGHTAAEIINEGADRTKPKMGLKSFKNSPKGRVLKSDVKTAKNYLPEKEIKKLERTVSSYFDYIENQIEQRKEFTMESLADSVNRFLEFNDYKVLKGKGKISMNRAQEKAIAEYEVFNKTQAIESD
ncbi:MAG: virulence RhuM family protein, partial [Candidatus Peregrinibacteria bacterium]|nr:virulence RhuM family protein [Candidatus Peregrinibacteria bacterium]